MVHDNSRSGSSIDSARPADHRPGRGAGADSDGTEQDQADLRYIRSELMRYRPDIPGSHSHLRKAVSAWLNQSTGVDAGSLETMVSSTLADLQSDNAMARQPTQTDGAASFPDRCQGCPHYGVACPVTTRNSQIERRERIPEQAADGNELYRLYQEYAIDNDCHVLMEELQQFEDGTGPLLEAGQKLLMATEDLMLFDDGDDTAARVVAARDAGPESFAKQVPTAEEIEALGADSDGEGGETDG